MQYLILIYADEKLYRDMGETEMKQLLAEYGAYTAALTDAGVIVGGAELAPVHTATTVRVREGKLVCHDGPFAETKEQLGGYYLIDTPDLDQAIAWAAKCPSAGMGAIEVRPLA